MIAGDSIDQKEAKRHMAREKYTSPPADKKESLRQIGGKVNIEKRKQR